MWPLTRVTHSTEFILTSVCAGMGHESTHIMGTNLTSWCCKALFCLRGFLVFHKSTFPLLGDRSSCPSTTPCPHQNQQLPSSAFPVQASPKAARKCTIPPKYKCPMCSVYFHPHFTAKLLHHEAKQGLRACTIKKDRPLQGSFTFA